MKKNLLRILLLAVLAVLLFSLPAAAHPPITVYVDGKTVEMDAPPVIENGRTLVPIRALAEALGSEVEWDAVNRRATIISTNFGVQELADHYGERNFSRIFSSYTPLRFFGEDIRIKKKVENA